MSRQNIKQFFIFLFLWNYMFPSCLCSKIGSYASDSSLSSMLDTLEKVLPLGSVKREVPDLLKKLRQKTFLLHLCFSIWHCRVVLQWSWFQVKSQPLPMIIIVHVKPGLALYPASLLEKEIFVLTVAHCVVHVRLAVHLTMDSSLNIGVNSYSRGEVWSLKPVNPQLSSQLISVRSLQRAPPLRSPGKITIFVSPSQSLQPPIFSSDDQAF